LLTLVGCGSHEVVLGQRSPLDGSADGPSVDAATDRDRVAEADADDRDDEALDDLPCTNEAQCTQRREPFCSTTLGRCVECLRDSDCRSNQRCERDGECDTPEDP